MPREAVLTVLPVMLTLIQFIPWTAQLLMSLKVLLRMMIPSKGLLRMAVWVPTALGTLVNSQPSISTFLMLRSSLRQPFIWALWRISSWMDS